MAKTRLSKLKRTVLDKSSEGKWFYLKDILPANYTRNQYRALHRTVRQLHDEGRIDIYRYMCGHFKALIGKKGLYPPNSRPDDN